MKPPDKSMEIWDYSATNGDLSYYTVCFVFNACLYRFCVVVPKTAVGGATVWSHTYILWTRQMKKIFNEREKKRYSFEVLLELYYILYACKSISSIIIITAEPQPEHLYEPKLKHSMPATAAAVTE